MENLPYATVRENARHEVEVTRRHATRQKQQIGGQALLNRCANHLRRVGRNPQRDGFGTEERHRRRHHRAVGVAGLPMGR